MCCPPARLFVPRFAAILFSVLSAADGLPCWQAPRSCKRHGVAVRSRTGEIGILVTLGAQPSDLIAAGNSGKGLARSAAAGLVVQGSLAAAASGGAFCGGRLLVGGGSG